MGPKRSVAARRIRFAVGAGLLAVLMAMAPAGATTLRVGATALPPSLGNPYRNTGIPHIFTWSAIFDGLTRIDATGQLQPWLATSWAQIDSATWRLTLRPGVTFSNGAPFTADAVVNAVTFLTSPEATREQVARELGLKSARRIDDLTVEITTLQPSPFLPRALPLLHMVEPDSWRRLGAEGFARAPVGTGPFKVTQMAANRWELAAVPTSWRAPKVDRLVFTVAGDATIRAQAVLANQIDVALQLGPSEVATIEAGGGEGVAWRNAAVWAINFHQVKGGHPALRDRRVREALNLAVDREALVQELLQGKTVAAREPAPAIAYGYDPDIPPIPTDPVRARALLAEAGYPNGFKFVLQAVVGSGPADGDGFQKIAQDLAKIGVTMEIRVFPVAQLLRSVVEGDWDGDAFALTYATEPTIDALRPLMQHSCLNPHPWYCNEQIMPAIRAALVESDPAKAIALRHDVMRRYRADYAALYLYEIPRFAGLRKGVRGFSELHGFIPFDRIEVPK